MDIFKSPWKTSIIPDPIVSLSNSKIIDRREMSADRFCTDSLKKNLFNINIEDDLQTSQSNTNINNQHNNIKTIDQKSKNYRGLLFKTCSSESKQKQCKNKNKKTVVISSGYTSKISRPGYLLNQQVSEQQVMVAKPRSFPKQPYRILNAPHLKDDFYTNLLDWSAEDLVSVVLDQAAYIWNSKHNQTQKLVQGFISSIKWGKGLIIGQQNGKMRVIDVQKKKQTFKHRSHNGRIGTIECMGNLVASGSKDCNVHLWDIRTKEIISKWQAHKQQVCGVKCSFDGNMIASGGNDNIVTIFDIRACKTIYKLNEHTAAVKAIAWSPHQNSILTTGGGSTDKCIRLWNIHQGKCKKKIDTGSQVCNMMYSTNSNQLVSTHGYSMNAINIWQGKSMQKIGTLRGHSYRVLYLAKSPDGESIITGSGDQTLRFWKIFPHSSDTYSRVSLLQAKNTNLR